MYLFRFLMQHFFSEIRLHYVIFISTLLFRVCIFFSMILCIHLLNKVVFEKKLMRLLLKNHIITTQKNSL